MHVHMVKHTSVFCRKINAIKEGVIDEIIISMPPYSFHYNPPDNGKLQIHTEEMSMNI